MTRKVNSERLHRNTSLPVAIAIARELGCSVGMNNCGEITIDHPSFGRPQRIHRNRKNTTAKLVTLLRRLGRGAEVHRDRLLPHPANKNMNTLE